MTCDLWQSKLDAYVDESCPPDERDAFEEEELLKFLGTPLFAKTV